MYLCMGHVSTVKFATDKFAGATVVQATFAIAKCAWAKAAEAKSANAKLAEAKPEAEAGAQAPTSNFYQFQSKFINWYILWYHEVVGLSFCSPPKSRPSPAPKGPLLLLLNVLILERNNYKEKNFGIVNQLQPKFWEEQNYCPK